MNELMQGEDKRERAGHHSWWFWAFMGLLGVSVGVAGTKGWIDRQFDRGNWL